MSTKREHLSKIVQMKLKNMRIDEISIVDKGANKKTYALFKRDIQKSEADDAAKKAADEAAAKAKKEADEKAAQQRAKDEADAAEKARLEAEEKAEEDELRELIPQMKDFNELIAQL